MTTLTSFSSLEISELEVKGLILSLFQVILVADGSNYLSHFFGTISHFSSARARREDGRWKLVVGRLWKKRPSERKTQPAGENDDLDFLFLS